MLDSNTFKVLKKKNILNDLSTVYIFESTGRGVKNWFILEHAAINLSEDDIIESLPTGYWMLPDNTEIDISDRTSYVTEDDALKEFNEY